MSKFSVIAQYIGYYEITIEAGSFADAIGKANEMTDELSLRPNGEAWKEADNPGSVSELYAISQIKAKP